MNLPRMAVMQIRNVFRRKTKHAAQECTGRTFLGVPAVLFCRTPCICIVYFKRLTVGLYTAHHGQGCPWFHAVAMFLPRKNSRSEVYTDVHF